jgi:3-deoxy-manno-octulosonate cytidylyltransferase (CMP-KDO synthetase)
MSELKTAALIPARFASSRFPGKALAEIMGKAMIVRVYQAVAKCKMIDQVYVATDDLRIKNKVEAEGGRVIMTSAQHQSGTDRIAEAAAEIEADLIVKLTIQTWSRLLQIKMIMQFIFLAHLFLTTEMPE